MTTLFDNTEITQATIPEQAYDSLVGDGKKYRDNEALARSRYEADNFITVLKDEGKSKDQRISELEDELKARATIQDFIRVVKEDEETLGTPAVSHSESRSQATGLDETKIMSLLDQKLNERQRQSQARQNVDYVYSELTKVWGAGVASKLQAKAEELSVSREFLQSVAESSPRAFLELVKPTAPAGEPTLVPASSVRSTVHSGARTQTWYEREMTKNKKLRLDPEFQKQMHRDAQAMGEKFFDK